MNPMAENLAAALQRIAELERRIDNMFRMGKVSDGGVDPEKQTVRLKIGKDEDGQPQLSPPRPYMQMGGALKMHTPPSEGQTMVLISPGGDLEQGFILPVTWNDANKSPSQKGDENVLTYGDVTATLRADGLVIKAPRLLFECGGSIFELTAGGLKMVADDYDFT